MADVMASLKAAMDRVASAKTKADSTAKSATEAQAEYEKSLGEVRDLRSDLNKQIDEALASVGVGPSDPRVTNRG